jgi:hypothetical protein
LESSIYDHLRDAASEGLHFAFWQPAVQEHQIEIGVGSKIAATVTAESDESEFRRVVLPLIASRADEPMHNGIDRIRPC